VSDGEAAGGGARLGGEGRGRQRGAGREGTSGDGEEEDKGQQATKHAPKQHWAQGQTQAQNGKAHL
jgi:hypothetical protein